MPAGFTAVIRDYTLYSSAGGAVSTCRIQNDDEAPVITFASLSAVGPGASDQWTGRIVVPEAGIISIFLSTVLTSAAVYVGGYLLRNVVS